MVPPLAVAPPLAAAPPVAPATAAAALIAGVASSELTPSEAAELGKLVESYVRTLEAAEFDARLRKLEEDMSR